MMVVLPGYAGLAGGASNVLGVEEVEVLILQAELLKTHGEF